MDLFGSVDIRIFNSNNGYCEILDLDASGNQFEPGQIDKYYGDELGGCINFYLPDSYVSRLEVTHDGSDAWRPEWFKIYTDYEGVLKIVHCDDGEWIENATHNITDCINPSVTTIH